ncbi:hypothetical protein BaRGS_00019137 [Batillaria attramentaria]|uniref:Uncharacterized protein n=1 Tax=Batillaria attramentaria TaxID=370345 RepID=A0ABD0KRK4_9CAEN
MVLGADDENRTVVPVKGRTQQQTSNGQYHSRTDSNGQVPIASKVYIEMDRVSHPGSTTQHHTNDPASISRQEGSTEIDIGSSRQFPSHGSTALPLASHNVRDERKTIGESVSKVTISGNSRDGSFTNDDREPAVNGRRHSRKVGVFHMSSPSPHAVFLAGESRENGDSEETEGMGNYTKHVGQTIPEEGQSFQPRRQQQVSQSPRRNVEIVVTGPENTEVDLDSGVDTEAGTPSPGLDPKPTATTTTTHSGENDASEQQSSRFQLHPVYEKRPGALKGTRKISQDSSGLTGAPRKISFQNPVRKISAGSDGSSANSQFVPSRKGSMVTIDQIPHIINASLQSYLQHAVDSESITEEAEDPDVEFRRSRAPRMSIFSMHSRRSSGQSDVTFWDPEESLPHADHYRHAYAHGFDQFDGYRPRPTLYQLREEPDSPTKSSVSAPLGEDLQEEKEDLEAGEKKSEKEIQPSEKKGWIQGVLVRCLLNIFGVMLFLRLTWITGQAGVGLATVIILLSSVVTTLTTMSMAAICTNGEVRGGGAYYMISRSLGPEFGGAIGVIFSLANAVAAAMYVVGFAETLRDLVKDNGGVITGDVIHDVRVIGCATTVLLLAVVMIGLDFETKAQLVLLVVLIVSIINYVVGTFLPPDEEQRRAGFVGYQAELFMQNLGPDFRESDGVQYSFFKVFAIFFPAATGILAGANISGDLKNPSSDIPKGTFLAIFITTIAYVGIVCTTGGSMLRDAVGTAVSMATNVTMSLEDIQQCGNATCQFGLHNSHAIMGVASAFGPLIYAGIFSATLSSALASLVSAPKVFQALGKDKLFPLIGYFAKGYGKNGEPRRGYLLTFLICIGMTCIGSLDIIAPIISNFFLMAYALINFSCFDAAFANSPGFRPSFRLYNKWLSLLGALVCVVIMFLLGWWAALVTVIVVTALYVYIKYRKPDVNWGSSGQAHAYNDALKSTLHLMDVNEHVKNFRPQILVLSGYPRNRPALVDLAASITKRQSLLLCAHIFKGDMQNHLRHLRSTAAYRWFHNRQIRAFYTSIAAPTVRHGAQALLQSQGLGKLRPNTLLLGFKNNWQLVDPRTVHNYVGIIHDAFDLHYGVGVLRVSGGLDTHKVADSLLDATDDTFDDLDNDSIDDGTV